jgi:hypothetical protein
MMQCALKRRYLAGSVQGATRPSVSAWSLSRHKSRKASTGTPSLVCLERLPGFPYEGDPDWLSIRSNSYLMSGRRLLACCV